MKGTGQAGLPPHSSVRNRILPIVAECDDDSFWQKAQIRNSYPSSEPVSAK